jgi:hypothetical protein
MARKLSQPIIEILLRNWTVLDRARTQITKSRELCSTARSRIQAIVQNGTEMLPSPEPNLQSSNDEHDVWKARSSAKAIRDVSKKVRQKSVLLRCLAAHTIEHSARLQNKGILGTKTPSIAILSQ